jgi:hypothetical protein
LFLARVARNEPTTTIDALGSNRMTDGLSPGFFETEFSYMWVSTFPFQPWYSAVEFKRHPTTRRGFDGLARNTLWFLLSNHVSLGTVCLWLLRAGRSVHGR